MNFVGRIIKRAGFLCASLCASILIVLSGIPSTNAAPVTPLPESLQNGGFESNPGTTTAGQFNTSKVPYWSTTEADSLMEIWHNNFNPLAEKNGPFPVRSGAYMCELNCTNFASIYQDIDTSSGAAVGALYQWTVWHMGRNGIDTAQLQLGAPGNLAVATDINGNTAITDARLAWGQHTGYYKPSPSAAVTRFYLTAVATAGNDKTQGNLVDDLTFFKVAGPTVQTISVISPAPASDTLANILNGAALTPSYAANSEYAGLTDVAGNPVPIPDLKVPGAHEVKVNLTDGAGRYVGYIISTIIVTPLAVTGDLSLTKSADNLLPLPGGTVTYTFVATNNTNQTITDVTVTDDTIDPGTLSPASVATLTPGQSATFTGTKSIPADTPPGTKIVNHAIASATALTHPISSEPAQESIQVIQPALTLGKSVDNQQPMAGETIRYSYLVSNTGSIPITNVKVTDDSLTDIVPVGIPSLAPGSSFTFTADYTVSAGASSGTAITNTATASGDSAAGAITSNTDSKRITVVSPGVSITKTVSNKLPLPGETVQYTFMVRNTGTVDLTDVSVNDPALGGTITPAFADIAAGASAAFTASYTVPADASIGQIIANTATASGAAPNGSAVSSAPADESLMVVVPQLTLAKTVDNAQPLPGDTVTYTYTVKNIGSASVSGVSVHDSMLSNIAPASVPSLAAGQTATFTATYDIPLEAEEGVGIVNTATATGTTPVGTVTSPQASQTIMVVFPGLSLTKTAQDKTPNPGDTETYLYTVKNTGEVPLYNVSVDDDKTDKATLRPASVAALEPGQTVTFTGSYDVSAEAAIGSETVNTAIATGNAINLSGFTANASAIVTVAGPNPKTGDDAGVNPYLILSCIAGLLFALLAVAKDRPKPRK